MGIIGILGCLAHWIHKLVNDTFERIFASTLWNSYRPAEEFQDDLPMSYVLRQCGSANLVVLLHKIRKSPRILVVILDLFRLLNDARTLAFHLHFPLV